MLSYPDGLTNEVQLGEDHQSIYYPDGRVLNPLKREQSIRGGDSNRSPDPTESVERPSSNRLIAMGTRLTKSIIPFLNRKCMQTLSSSYSDRRIITLFQFSASLWQNALAMHIITYQTRTALNPKCTSFTQTLIQTCMNACSLSMLSLASASIWKMGPCVSGFL